VKKFAGFLAVFLLLICFSTANATLLGLEPYLGYPDIQFDTTGQIHYTSSTGQFILTAQDRTITLEPNTPAYSLTDNNTGNYVTTLTITFLTDGSGNIDDCEAWMVEELAGEVSFGDYNFANEVLLQGPVTQFGWGTGSDLGDFDFVVDPVSGALVDAGIWNALVPTYIIAHAEVLSGWTGNWNCDFTLDKVKGDKAPAVPEPATMLLLGAGLIGLAGIGRKKLFNR
jgi:hypothetical protein